MVKGRDAMKTFEEIASKNVNDHTEGRNGLTYLSWSWAWDQFKRLCPDANYEVIKFDGIPYVYDEKTGYMVYTKVTATLAGNDGPITHEMWLPVMDSSNKAMKAEPYTYIVKSYGKEVEKTAQAATMFDINKTIMRCLTKNLAMFGLGLYIYSGEDLPEQTEEEKKAAEELKKKITKKEADVLGKTLTDAQKAWVVDTYHVNTLEELTVEQYGKLMRTLNERK